jgi:hypothetical protein
MRLILSILTLLISFVSLNAQKKEDVTKRMASDISYLASDQLEGRLTGSSGEMRSSLYIADQFRMNGVAPKGNDSGSYFQTFSIVRLRISQYRGTLLWTDKNEFMRGLKADQAEFYPLSQSCNLDSVVNVPTFYAGFGILAPENNYSDYQDTTGIRGKVFIIKLGSPEASNPHGKYSAYESLNYKVDQAIKLGARGVVFINTDTSIENPKGKLDREIKPRPIPVLFASTMQASLMNAKLISFKVDIKQINSTAHNVIGFINNKKAKTIIIGAHQDHLGYNEFGGSRDTKGGQIHNGADDNASGVAMMLELMRKIKKSKKLRNNNFMFIAFSGEEQGLLGSNYFVNHPVIDVKSVQYMLNFDMVGRLDSNKKTLMIYGVGTTPQWKTSIAGLKTDSTQIKIKTTESGTGSSDHTSFYYSNIPVLHFFTGQHQDYHMPSDDEPLINYNGMYQVYGITMQLIQSVNKIKDLPFTATKSEESTRMAFKVSLGIMPDYIFDGLGLRIDGVNLGKPGEKAGMMKGDIIIKMNDFVISNIQDYMKALSQFKKGDTIPVIVKRGSEEKTLQVTF